MLSKSKICTLDAERPKKTTSVNFNHLKFIFTEQPEKALEEKHIFNLFVFLTSLLFFLATAFNYEFELGNVTFASLIGGILVFSVYLISRFYVYNQKVVVLLIIVSSIVLFVVYITNFGIKGPIIYNFIALGMAILFFLKNKNRVFFLIFLIISLICLFIFEYHFLPNLGDYVDNKTRIMDHGINWIINFRHCFRPFLSIWVSLCSLF